MIEDYGYDPEERTQRGDNVFSRICAGYIESIDTEQGKVIVSLEDFIGTRNSVELSFAYISSVNAGWIRFMPSIGDKVLCGFRPNNELEILRYKAISYPQLAEQAQAGVPSFIFRKLKSGEFEIVSSGYAEIWGSQLGRLHLAGGLASIDLDRPTTQITHNAVLHYLQADGSEYRLGAVRRHNPFKTTEDNAMVAPGVPQRECKTVLVQSILGTVPIPLYEATMGAVLDYVPALPIGIFTPRLYPNTGLPLVADIEFYTIDGIQNTEIRIDNAGNTQVDLPATALDGLRINVDTGTVNVSALNVDVSATASLDISGTAGVTATSAVDITLSAPFVNLGSDAPPYSVGLAEVLTARIVALESKLNEFITLFNAHIHLMPLPFPPTLPTTPSELPLIPNPTPTGSVKVKVDP